jgi:Ca-activated chloride channel homolog
MVNTKKENKKKYLKNKITASVVMFWVLCGFLGGITFGELYYYEQEEDKIRLTLVYSSEKSSWISETQTLFMKYWAEKQAADPSLKPIILDFQPYGSGDSLIALLNGEIKPTIWSPASNIWVPLLNAKWQALTDKPDLLVNNFTRLIYSPVVIATWENILSKYPFNGLNDLHDIIINNPNLIKMAHTDPRSSNSGFMASIMMVSSFLSMDSEKMTLTNISNDAVIKWMTEFESAAIFYGKSTGFLGKYMRDQGPDALQVAILYENLVQDYSIPAEQKHGQKIVAVYPEEGSLYSDHPFCILDSVWVSEEQKALAQEYINFIGQKELISKAIETGFRPINSSILSDPTINAIYNKSFNENHGVTANSSIIKELLPPSDGNVIGRVPDLWLLTRNSV